jgi:hypothetical protein
VLSPFTPFLTEAMYQNLKACLPPGAPESVHFCDIPAEREVGVAGDDWLGGWRLVGGSGWLVI